FYGLILIWSPLFISFFISSPFFYLLLSLHFFCFFHFLLFFPIPTLSFPFLLRSFRFFLFPLLLFLFFFFPFFYFFFSSFVFFSSSLLHFVPLFSFLFSFIFFRSPPFFFHLSHSICSLSFTHFLFFIIVTLLFYHSYQKI